MLKISKKSQYGLRAMVCLAKFSRKNQISSTKMISGKEDIPFDFLEKIILQLEKAKLVKAKKGISGGYFLAKKPNKISVGNIVSALEGKKPLVNCIFCDRAKKCAAKNVWGKIQNSMDKTLESIKLSQLI
jgi:Rrf2 family protein